jgi:NAD(P)-dependent dehydrogenase (short-subunit alcohol dehydrogenase family)
LDLDLKDAVVLVTGGTDGLGLALAKRLVDEGAKVAVCGRDEGRLRSTEEQLQGSGEAVGVVADVTSPADLERFVAVAVGRWGRIDGLANNAGRHSLGALESIPDSEWAYDFDLKFMAAVRLCRLVLPHMRTAGGGSIVNTLAMNAKAPGERSMPTAASRAAGMALTKALSKEVAGDRIRVNAILPGAMLTGFVRGRAEASGKPAEELTAQMAENIPIGRVGTGEDFAHLAAFLLSPCSSYITGTAINLDGGRSPVV